MVVSVSVIGAGRMGTVVAKQLPATSKKSIIDLNRVQADKLAAQIAGESSASLEAAKDADLIAVVLPTAAVNKVVDQLTGIAKDGAVIINMATTAKIDPEILNKNKRISIIDAKIIGHAMSMSKGEPGILVVKTDNMEAFRLIKSQMTGFSDVVLGDADLVPKMNIIGSTEGIRAAVGVRKQLRQFGDLPEDWVKTVIRTVCAGTMKSYTENDLGHFARELADKLEAED